MWGQKEERTPTWFSMFVEDSVDKLPLKGEKTPMVEAMQRVWTGKELTETAPVVKRMTINPSLIVNLCFSLLLSILQFSFAPLCTTNFFLF